MDERFRFEQGDEHGDNADQASPEEKPAEIAGERSQERWWGQDVGGLEGRKAGRMGNGFALFPWLYLFFALSLFFTVPFCANKLV